MATTSEFSRMLATAVHQIRTHINFKSRDLYAGINPVGTFFDALFKDASGRTDVNSLSRGRKELERIAKSMHGKGDLSILKGLADLFPSAGFTMSNTGKQKIYDIAKKALAKQYSGTQNMTASQRLIANVNGAISAAEYTFRELNPDLAKKADYREKFGDFWEEPYNADRESKVKRYKSEKRRSEWATNRRFHLLMMDDYDREREELASEFGGSRANKLMRKKVLDQLPEFFKNSKKSTKDLYKIAGYAKAFPRISKALSFTGSHPLLAAAQGVRFLYKIGMDQIFADAKDYVSSIASGLSYSEGRSGGSSIAGYGGGINDIRSASGSWYGNVGDILMGGDLGKLVALDRFGINPMGSGPGGFATHEEQLVRIAKQLPKLDKARQLALKNNPMIHISDSMFAAMLDHPNDFKEYLHRNDYMSFYGVNDELAARAGIRQKTKWADSAMAWSGVGSQLGVAFESTSDILADFSKWGGLAVSGGLKLFNNFDKKFTEYWGDFWFNWFDGPSNERSILHALFGSDSTSSKANDAAKSLQNYELSTAQNGGTSQTTTNSKSLTVNVNGLTVTGAKAKAISDSVTDAVSDSVNLEIANANDPGGM